LSEHTHHSFLAGSLPMASAGPVRTGAMGFLVNFFSGLCSTKFRGVDKVIGPRSDVPALNPVATDR
jgi:hypothetical protein